MNEQNNSNMEMELPDQSMKRVASDLADFLADPITFRPQEHMMNAGFDIEVRVICS